ncbi:hypothetical protein TNCV_864151 [Trichonephila clavipes]|nr:hypothetical protein TNCV_864151 [Trichonephila clavipes]
MLSPENPKYQMTEIRKSLMTGQRTSFQPNQLRTLSYKSTCSATYRKVDSLKQVLNRNCMGLISHGQLALPVVPLPRLSKATSTFSLRMKGIMSPLHTRVAVKGNDLTATKLPTVKPV